MTPIVEKVVKTRVRFRRKKKHQFESIRPSSTGKCRYCLAGH